MQNLRIHNFQSLRNISLTLGGFTTIEGDSRTGKSAMIRAISALAYNVRSTKPYVRHGEPLFDIEADFDGRHVKLSRGAGTSYYEVDDERFEKMGFSVPDAVAEVTGFRVVEYDKDLSAALQVQGQFEEPFLLGSRWTGTSVTKVLASVSRLNVLYVAQKLAKKRQRESQTAIRNAQERRDGLDENLKVYESVPGQMAGVLIVGEYVNALGILERWAQELERLQEDWRRASDRLAAVATPTSKPANATLFLQKLQATIDSVARLRALSRAYQNAENMLVRVVLPETCPDAGAFCYNVINTSLERVQSLRSLKTLFDSAIVRENRARISMDAAGERRGAAEAAEVAFFAELETCPFCGQAMPA